MSCRADPADVYDLKRSIQKMNENLFPWLPRLIKTIKTVTMILLAWAGMMVLSQCDTITDSDENDDESLYVKFMNDSLSQFTVTGIEMQDMGVAGESTEPVGSWSENILPDSAAVPPDGHVFLTLSIKNQHWVRYRVYVDDGNGNEILLQTDDDTSAISHPSITHWGSHQRTVSITIRYNAASESIYIFGWSDFAGIE